jgi:hypothetical protein
MFISIARARLSRARNINLSACDGQQNQRGQRIEVSGISCKTSNRNDPEEDSDPGRVISKRITSHLTLSCLNGLETFVLAKHVSPDPQVVVTSSSKGS